jgi:hypothetical protein
MEMIFMILAIAFGAPMPADGIHVSPGTARPGQRVHITVPDCAVGPTRHTAASDAFTRRATLHGKADTGEADVRLKDGLSPGTYRITASCGTSTVLGQVVVPGQRPEAPKPRSNTAPYWMLGVALTGGAALLIARRRRR